MSAVRANVGNLRKPCQSPKPLLWCKLSFPLCMMPGLRNRSEFEVCLRHSNCENYAIQDVRRSLIVQNFGNQGKARQRPKPLLWLEVSFPSVLDAWADEQEWVWGLSTAFTLQKLCNPRYPQFPDHAKFWKSEKNSSKPKASALIWAIISFSASCLGWGTGVSWRSVYGIHIAKNLV